MILVARYLHPWFIVPISAIAPNGLLPQKPGDNFAFWMVMSFFEEFCRAFLLNPVKALTALYWYVTRRRVRGRNLLRRISSQAPYVYDLWIRTVEGLADITAQAPAAIASWSDRPAFSILLTIEFGANPLVVRAMVEAVKRQSYDDWELLLVGPADAAPDLEDDDQRIRWIESADASDVSLLQEGVAAARHPFIVPLAPGVRLSPGALYRFGEMLRTRSDAEILYGDEDRIDAAGRRCSPWFKPLWNREMFLAQDYISSACAIRTSLARTILVTEDMGGAARYAMVLEASMHADDRIVHVPFVIAHRSDAMDEENTAVRQRVVARYVAPMDGTTEEGPFGSVRVRWPLPSTPPLVSIVVPTRDKVHLLRTCIESVRAYTTYPSYEILIVDNRSVEPATKDYFAHISAESGIRILSYDAEFNFSEMNNQAVAQARGDHICLLNNDTEVVAPDWLGEMMRYAVRDDVGAVGARLLYPDGTIQHAGVVIGMGGAAGHAHRLLPAAQRGYFERTHVAHFVSAVTAACLVVEKRKFELVGGLDAELLQVAFNDVDLCLKLERAGWRNVYVPQATLMHYESKSRGSDMLPKNVDRYLRELAVLQERWRTQHYRDPLHHPHLDLATETFVVRL